MIRLLDCTLREAPVKNLAFGEKLITDFITGLENSKLDVIEVGFLKNGTYLPGSTIFSRTEQIEPYLKNKKTGVLYVALVDFGRFDLENLSPYNGKSIDGIRICFKKHEREQVICFAEEIKKKGYKIFIQCVDSLGYDEQELRTFIQKVNILEPYAFSIVDTFGGMYLDDVERIYSLVSQELDAQICLGFHGHNNLLLANSNAQYFISRAKNERREIMVDTSMMGCGRGAGNAHSELLAEYLNKFCGCSYNMEAILDLLYSIMPQILKQAEFGYSIPYFLSGKNQSHVFNVDYLKKYGLSFNDIWSVISKLDTRDKKAYNYPKLDELANIRKGKADHA